jgi:CheY-like chemotaxis protein
LNIFEAKNGKEAIESIKLNRPDMVLMDLVMPEIGGEEVTRILKEDKDLKTIPVIVITASVSDTPENTVKCVGCDSIITKPVKKRDLIIELMRFLSHSVKGTVFVQAEKPYAEEEKAVFTKHLTQETISILPELIDILQNKMLNKWKKVQKTFVVDEIKKFAGNMKELGEKYSLGILTNWGDDLFKQAKSFDMKKLPDTLNHFPDLVEEITGLVKK